LKALTQVRHWFALMQVSQPLMQSVQEVELVLVKAVYWEAEGQSVTQVPLSK
jgi:hypothetical protein